VAPAPGALHLGNGVGHHADGSAKGARGDLAPGPHRYTTSEAFQNPEADLAGLFIDKVTNGQGCCGGNTSLPYSGTYSQSGDDFTATIKTSRHALGLPSVFGVDAVDTTLRGKSTSTGATFTGTAAQAPQITFQAALNRMSD